MANNNKQNNPLDELIYTQLKNLARKMMSRERANHTLSATDLVHEAFAKLAPSKLSYNDQRHYFHTFARQMRRVLLNHAKQKKAQKNHAEMIYWTESLGVSQSMMIEFDVFNDAIESLEQLDKRSAMAIELVYFTELNQSQAAEVLDVSIATLERDLKFGRVVIHEYIDDLGKNHE